MDGDLLDVTTYLLELGFVILEIASQYRVIVNGDDGLT